MNIDFQKIRAEAAQYKLSGRELLEERTDEQLAEICNGIGAQWLDRLKIGGTTLSDYINRLWPSWVVVACIHDIRYSVGGTEADRKAADEEFRDNCDLITSAKYSILNWRHWRDIWEARTVYRVLRAGGKPAFNYKEEPQ